MRHEARLVVEDELLAAAVFAQNVGLQRPAGTQEQGGEEDRHLQAVFLGVAEDAHRPVEPDLVAGIYVAFNGVDQSVELDELEELFVAHRQVAMHAQAQDLTAVEHGLGQRDVVAREELMGRGHVKGAEDVVGGQVGVQPVEHRAAADVVLAGDLL